MVGSESTKEQRPDVRDSLAIDCLAATLQGGRRLVVYLHDNPDPDTIAAGLCMARIGEHLGLRPVLVHGGNLGRAENQAMVRILRIPLRRLEGHRIRQLATDRYALVDTQPGAGNNSFPEGRRAHVVLDHHGRRRGLAADFVDVRHDEGCCTTLALDYLRAFGIEPDPILATACAYAILSETQDLKREATRQDREAWQFLTPLVRQPLLGRIRHPVRSREYYRTISRALQRMELGRHTVICHAGEVPYAEVVAEVADFLVDMDRISWCLASGIFDGRMVLSLRTTDPRGGAERVMKRILRGLGKGGGHGLMAGGALPCPDGDAAGAKASQVSTRFLRALRRRTPEKLKPLCSD
jgi:nanoRNase/pAp phosphatase (c-di-AMP/oligoRNAs hydrolase)